MIRKLFIVMSIFNAFRLFLKIMEFFSANFLLFFDHRDEIKTVMDNNYWELTIGNSHSANRVSTYLL